MLRSSWQTVNIGDIAHTPGVLHLLEKHIPEAEVRLRPSGHLRPEWVDRYGKRLASVRLPQKKDEREALALAIGEDGFIVMGLLRQPDAPPTLLALPEVEILRRVWIQNYVFEEGKLCWRDTKDMPTAAHSINSPNSPHDPEARYSIKRDTTWAGYKAHFNHIDPYMKAMASLLHKNRAPMEIMNLVAQTDRAEAQAKQAQLWKTAGRNDSCPCGSGSKFKKCCMGKAIPAIK